MNSAPSRRGPLRLDSRLACTVLLALSLAIGSCDFFSGKKGSKPVPATVSVVGTNFECQPDKVRFDTAKVAVKKAGAEPQAATV